MAAYADSGRCDHAFEQTAHIFAYIGIDADMLFDVLQFHLLQ